MTQDRIHCCTWAKSVDSPELSLFKASASRQGIEPTVLPCGGFLEKPVKLLEFASALPDDDLLLFSDGYDVLYVDPLGTILDRFRAFSAPLVMGGEDGCYHHLPEVEGYLAGAAPGAPYPFLNSGLGLGTVSAVREMLESVIGCLDEVRERFQRASHTRGFFNDQTLIGDYASRYPDRVEVDSRAELFWTMASEKFDVGRHAEVRPGGLRNLNTGTRPSLVHVSHRRKFYLPYLQIADRLGLALTRRDVDLDLVRRLLDATDGPPDGERPVIDPEVRERLESLCGVDPVRPPRSDGGPILMAPAAQAPAGPESDRPGGAPSPGAEARSTLGQSCERLAVLFIGTGRYINYFADYCASSRSLLLPETPKTYWVFTDQVDHPSIRGCEAEVVLVEVPPERWPLSTLLRFRYINRVREQLLDYSHILYLDADMVVCSEITEREFFDHPHPLCGVQHPGNFLHGQAPYATQESSRACVAGEVDTSLYWQGCLWGGRADAVLDMSWVLARRIDDDLERDVIATWHDESHLNKYFAESPGRVHTFHPGYAYPEALDGKLGLEKKILHLAKKHQVMRSAPARVETTSSAAASGVVLAPNDCPVRPDGLRLERTPGGAFAIRGRDDRELARINATAAQIWLLCDGDTDVEALVKIMGAVSFTTASAVDQDIRRLLGSLIGHGLISIRKESATGDGRAGLGLDAPARRPPTKSSAERPSSEIGAEAVRLEGAKAGQAELKKSEPAQRGSGKAGADRSAVLFYSFANDANAGLLRELKGSADAEDIDLCILGHGLRRLPTTLKLDLLYARVRDLNDRQIVCAVDAFDVFFCAGAAEIERKFRAMDVDCLFSAERAYSHQYPRYRSFYDALPTDSPYRYLNSGSIIGYAGALKQICAPTLSTRLQPRFINPRSINKVKSWASTLARALKYRDFDSSVIYSYVYYTDQQHYGRYVARNPRKLRIALDHGTELFWNTALEWRDISEHYRIEDGRLVNAHTGQAPAVIHVPGWRVHRKVLEELYAVHNALSATRRGLDEATA
ncbi:MAG: PqqD family peptide modification chaperone [Acidobacteriota bacterium]